MSALDFWKGHQEPSLLSSWDSMHRDFDRLFGEMDRVFSPMRQHLGHTMMVAPSCEVREKDGAFVVEFDIPGIAKDDLEIEATGNQLVISGERKADSDDAQGSRRYGKFRRSFTLPEGTNMEEAHAHYDNGVLQLTIPKSEAAKPRKISISDGKGGFLKKLSGKDSEKNAAHH